MTELGRRPLLKGAGAALAGLGGLASPVAAKKGGKTNLTDRAADVLVYFSTPHAGDGDADQGDEFGFPATPVDPNAPTDGLFVGRNDAAYPSPGSQFNFGKIEMTPNGGSLHNSFEFFAGALLASKPKPYVLAHLGGGLYESRGQVMRFEARELDEMPLPFRPSPPAQILQGGTWRAVATEQARLGLTTSGRPDPTSPEWGVTRIDFYDPSSRVFVMSLLYVIVADETDLPMDGLMTNTEVYGVASDLINGGRLNPGGR